MDAVTYPEPRIVALVSGSMIPVRENVSSAGNLSRDFAINHTPTVVVTDGTGKEFHRTVGFLPPDEFLPALLLGIGKALMDAKRYTMARAKFDGILAGYQTSQVARQARELIYICNRKIAATLG